MGRRFEELERFRNHLIAADIKPTAFSADNEIRKYMEWKADPELRKRPNASKVATGDRKPVGLKAFGLPSTNNGDEVQIKLGERAITQIKALDNALRTPLELTLDNIPDTFTPLNGFQPAKVVAGVRSQDPSSVPSKITGRSYKKRIDTTYTFAFGKGGAGNETEFAQQERIIAAFSNGYVVTFKPESLRRN